MTTQITFRIMETLRTWKFLRSHWKARNEQLKKRIVIQTILVLISVVHPQVSIAPMSCHVLNRRSHCLLAQARSSRIRRGNTCSNYGNPSFLSIGVPCHNQLGPRKVSRKLCTPM